VGVVLGTERVFNGDLRISEMPATKNIRRESLVIQSPVELSCGAP
jgi:hypothetical protein